MRIRDLIQRLEQAEHELGCDADVVIGTGTEYVVFGGVMVHRSVDGSTAFVELDATDDGSEDDESGIDLGADDATWTIVQA
jgi:hypothetical protein